MFNSLAYNCDFQDAIGNSVLTNIDLLIPSKAQLTRQPTGALVLLANEVLAQPSQRTMQGTLQGIPNKEKASPASRQLREDHGVNLSNCMNRNAAWKLYQLFVLLLKI